MRPRLSAIAIRQGESHANRTHRSISDALSILIDAGYRSLTGAQESGDCCVDRLDR